MPSTPPTRIDTPDEATLVLGARRCAPMGRLDYLVQLARPGVKVHMWYVVAPDPSAWRGYAAFGIDLDARCRVVFDADTLRPLAVLGSDDDALPAEPPPPCSHNPYFDQLPPGPRST